MFVAVFVAMVVATTACRKSPPAGDAGPNGASASGSTPTSTQPGQPPSVPSPVGSDSPEPGWSEARSGDPLELARLADVEGPDALAEVALDEKASPADRATAIRALMFVDDPSPAVEALAKLVGDSSIDRSTLALQTLASIAPKRLPIEELEPGAWRVAGETLVKALSTIQGPARREIALRALHGLAERGAVAPSAIPAR